MAEHVSKTAWYRMLHGGFLCWMLASANLVMAENLQDPTRPPAAFSLQQEGNVAVMASGPVLQSVLISPGRKVAIISGQTVKLGEKFGDSRVVSITEGEVVLRSGKALQTLKLFPDVHKQLTSGSIRRLESTRRQ